jgi:2-polyprenyl-6-methoxyphenol hydroxylase-like FAD-dependent oxidoreductase
MTASDSSDTEVLIAGAGPTGLVLALWLTRLGRKVRIVDRAAGPGTTSRAIAVQARTLEHYRQLGLADQIVGQGLKFGAANLWAGGTKRARMLLGDLGGDLSAYPFVLSFPQDQHERFLIELLARAGVVVERGVEVIGFSAGGGASDGVRVELRDAAGAASSVVTAGYLAGCDGAHSIVRRQLDLGFDGGTYAHLFYVADVRAHGPMMDGELHVALDDADFLAVFPLSGASGDAPRARLIGTVRAAAADETTADARARALTWDDVSQDLLRRLRIDVDQVSWFSTYRVHHRVARQFRSGRAFLLGDAAHVHSPVGGQGMNTGLGDAVNLAWKLAAVLAGRADESLLDSYQPERIAFARQLVATTDRMFTAATSATALARFVRLVLLPGLLPTVFRLPATRRLMFRTVSQIGIHYRDSPLSAGHAGGVHAGDRLPWLRFEGDRVGGVEPPARADNYAPLASLDWQAHVYGQASAGLTETCHRRGLALQLFADPRSSPTRHHGIAANALYLVRPDGHVAWADPAADGQALERYLDQRRLHPGGASR